MSKAILIVMSCFMISSLTFAESYCVTNAQCQNLSEESTACFLVQDGIDAVGNTTCSTRCFTVYVGSYCKFAEGKSYGVCKEEDYKKPRLSNTKKNCENAIPSNVINEVFIL